MTKTETAQLLTLIAAFDRRTIGDADVEAWHLILEPFDVNDCMAAVKRHYETERSWLMPADIRTFAYNAEQRRLGETRRAALDAQIAQENPTAELQARPVAALTVGQSIPGETPEDRAARRAMLRQAAHTKRKAIEADTAAANDHRARVEAARRELHPEAS